MPNDHNYLILKHLENHILFTQYCKTEVVCQVLFVYQLTVLTIDKKYFNNDWLYEFYTCRSVSCYQFSLSKTFFYILVV